MKRTTALLIVAGALVLTGCADTGHYPISGQAVGAQDQVQFMRSPEVVRY